MGPQGTPTSHSPKSGSSTGVHTTSLLPLRTLEISVSRRKGKYDWGIPSAPVQCPDPEVRVMQREQRDWPAQGPRGEAPT